MYNGIISPNYSTICLVGLLFVLRTLVQKEKRNSKSKSKFSKYFLQKCSKLATVVASKIRKRN
jgi:hypothetical protein